MRKLSFFLALLTGSVSARGQSAPDPVRYALAFPNAAHHEAQVVVEFPGTNTSEPLHVRMSRASPGRYALHEFAKNVYDVYVTDVNGHRLAVTRPDPYGWDVARPPQGGPIRFAYTLFGDRADGTYAGIDPERAHLNMPATLVWAKGLESLPCRVSFGAPPDAAWDVATQLLKMPDGTWQAPHLQYLMDSPTLLTRLSRRSWVQNGQKLEIAVAHRGAEAEVDSLAARTQRITRTAEAVWGTLPLYDFGQYTFIANYLPTAAGDGMEHRNSTSLTLPRALKPSDADHLGTISHEFFHGWNVERLRPADLEPFDFERANMSDMLWLAEGFTQYYGDLILRRAHLITDTDYAQELTGLVVQMNLPGAGRFSPVEMSRQAPFVDAARSVDPVNRLNTYVSYYTIGGGTALALDLELRARNHTLDELMRVLWRDFGSRQANYAPVRPYHVTDMQHALTEVTSDSAFAGQYFRRFVYGHQPHDWATLLAPAGLTVQLAEPTKVWLGALGYEIGAAGMTLVSGTPIRSPLYEAGLDRGDVIKRFDGRPLKTEKDMEKVLAKHKPGDVVPITVSQRGLPARETTITLAGNPALKVRRNEDLGRPLTDAQQAFRQAWWGK